MIKKVQITLGNNGFTRFFTEENESEMLDYCNKFLTDNDVADGQTMMSFEDYIAVNAHLAEKFDDPYNSYHFMEYVEDAWEDAIIYIAERFGEHNWSDETLVSLLSDLGVFFKPKEDEAMTKEEKELLLHLLKKADEDGLLNIYDYEDNFYETGRINLDGDDFYIKVKPFIA